RRSEATGGGSRRDRSRVPSRRDRISSDRDTPRVAASSCQRARSALDARGLIQIGISEASSGIGFPQKKGCRESISLSGIGAGPARLLDGRGFEGGSLLPLTSREGRDKRRKALA